MNPMNSSPSVLLDEYSRSLPSYSQEHPYTFDPDREANLGISDLENMPTEQRQFLCECTMVDSFHWKVKLPPEPHSFDDEPWKFPFPIYRATIKNFFPERGFGFLNTVEGDLFFHAASYREPRFRKDGECYRIEWKQLRADKKHRHKAPVSQRLERTPLPTIQFGEPVLYQLFEANGQRVRANLWCLTSMYNDACQAWRDDNLAEEARIAQLPEYQLLLWCRRFIADAWYAKQRILFEGNNLAYLQQWYQDRAAQIRNHEASPFASEIRFILRHRLIHEGIATSEWETIPTEVMHDFLSQPLSTIAV